MWNIEAELAESGLEPSRPKSVRLIVPGLTALVGTDLEVMGAFEDHGSVGEHFGDDWNAIKNAVLKKGVDCVVGEGSVGVSGHGWVSG